MHPRVGATRRGVFHVEPARQHRPARAGNTVPIGPLRQRSPSSTDPYAPPDWVRCARASSRRSIPGSRCASIAFSEVGADQSTTRRPPRKAPRKRAEEGAAKTPRRVPGGFRGGPAPVGATNPQPRPTRYPRRQAGAGRMAREPDAPGSIPATTTPRMRPAAAAGPRAGPDHSNGTPAGRTAADSTPRPRLADRDPPASERRLCRDGRRAPSAAGARRRGRGVARRSGGLTSGDVSHDRDRGGRRVPMSMVVGPAGRDVTAGAGQGNLGRSPIAPGPLLHVKQDPCEGPVSRARSTARPRAAPRIRG